MLELRILGALEAFRDGVRLQLGPPKQQALLAVLLLNANRVVSIDDLRDELWGDEAPMSARHSVEVYVSGLRKALGADRITTVAPGYAVRVEPDEFDVDRFERLLRDGRRALATGRAGAARDLLAEALLLWRGEPLAGIAAGPRVENVVARLADLRLGGLEARIDAELELGICEELIGELQGLIAEHPLREALYSRLMLALYRSGRQADALEVFQRARKTLLDELGLEPSRPLQDLERSILNQDPAVERPVAAAVDIGLPAKPASFVGRLAELDSLRTVLRSARLVTLTGAGGIGKTRLAIEAARLAAHRWRHGVAFVALAPVRRSEDVPAAIAAAIGLGALDGSPETAVASHLRDRELLLVLDNFEHVREEATFVSKLVSSCPRLTVLATSRAPLRIYGEHEFAVPPLGVDGGASGGPSEAAVLFLDRAQAARPDAAAEPGDAELVEEICARLDGVPLAIELAAARMKILSAQDLLAAMVRPLELLVDGPRDVPERHRTLRAAIEWSHDLLGPAEQRAFARLAVFSGGFTLDTAEAVCGASVEQVGLLRDSGLLRADAGVRFGMLETIREFGAERLAESSELAELRRRHAEFFVRLAERAEPKLRGPDQVEWLRRLEAEQANLWAACDWAFEANRPDVPLRLVAGLWRYWEARASISQARRYLERALAKSADLDPSIRAKALFSSGRIAIRQGDLEQAATAFAAGEALSSELGDPGGTALCLAGRGWIVHSVGPTDEAVRLCRAAVELARSSQEDWIVADALNNLGVALRAGGDDPGSRAALEESLALRRAIGDLEGVTAALNGLALLAVANDDIDEADALFREAFAASEGRGDVFYDAARDVVLAYVAFARADMEQAETLSRQAFEASQRHGYRQFTAYSLELFAGIAASEGRFDHAALLVGAALATAEELGRSYRRRPGGRSPGVQYDWDARAVKSLLVQARRKVGAAAWEATVDKGRRLDPCQAVEQVFAGVPQRGRVRVA